MKKNLLIASTAILAVTLVSPAFADEKDARIKALEAQLEFLMGEVSALKAERAQDKQEFKAEVEAAASEAAEKAANEATAQIAQNIEPAAGNIGDITEFRKGDFTLKPFGRLHLDAAVFDDDERDHPDGAEFRRARLGVKGQVTQDIDYKLEIDFANEDVNLKSAYINYTGIEDTDLRLGNFKPGFTLENAISSNDITFVERAAAVNAFSQSEIIGAGAMTRGDNWFAALGIFNDDAGRQSSDDEAISVSGRVVAAPINTDETTLHLGAAGSYRKPDQANDTFDFDARAGNALQSIDSVAANFTDGDDAVLYGLEAAVAHGPFSVQGEYIMADASRETPGASDVDFSGGYGQIAYTLTGESRPYSIKKGAFKGIKPKSPVSIKNGDWGAWEVAARYEHLDVSDDNILGGEMNNYTLGLNWYVNNNIRFLANYINVNTDENAITPNDDPQIFVVRSQLKF